MPATPPFNDFQPEAEDEPTVDVSFTMRELTHIVSSIAANYIWGGWNTGFAIHQKCWPAIARLQRVGDEKMVTKMMAAPVGGRKP